jgi:glycosyltransferase involved in cell wall biosynthesis
MQLRRFRALRLGFRRVLRTVVPDVVYINDLAQFDKAIAFLGSPFGAAPFLGMLISIRFHHHEVGVVAPHRGRDRILRLLFRRLLGTNTLRAVLSNDSSLAEFPGRGYFSCWEKIIVVPDLGTVSGRASREEARRRLGIKDQQVVVLLYGSLEPRKGLSELLRAAADTACPQNVVVVIAGQRNGWFEDCSIGKWLASLRSQGRILQLSGFLDEEAEARCFRAADVVWLGYRGFYGMSGVLIQAATVGVPVLSCLEGVVGWMVRRHGLGLSVDVGQQSEVVSALRRLATDAKLRGTLGANGRALAGHHSPQGFGRRVCDAIGRGAGT